MFLLGWYGIQISTRVGTLLGLFEIGVFAALAIWLIVDAGGNNDLSVFGTSFATVEGFDGISGVIAGSVYTILAFIGFEAAAPLAEETKDPRKTIGRAVILSCIGIGLFYILTTYAAAVYFGPAELLRVPALRRGEPVGRARPRGVGRRLGAGVPRDRELGDRQLERQLERGHADVVRDGADPHPARDPG